MPSHHLTTPNQPKKEQEQICVFAQTTYRNQMRRFGIKTDDRRRHMYVIGKTGMGKTTIMENMVLSDIYAGHGVGLVDPHGDFAEKIINHIPSWRLNDVVYLNPADLENPMGFNILEVKTEEQKHLVAGGLMGTFKKIWPDVWSSRMEYILNNTILALLDYPGSTLLGINRLLADKEYRKRVVRQLKDPVIKAFWRDEFASYSEKYAQEAVAPIQNKIGQFLSAAIIRNMVAQVKSTINVRDLMDSRKIFIMNLSKGRIGEDNSRLLGGMLITKLQLSAMERVDTPEADRKDFFLYVDEFQNFATPSFANILSEARKYRLSLIMAHQYVAQLDEVVADAVFGNVGTIVTFRVGGADAEMLVKEFTPTFTEEDIVNLTKFQVILKLMIDGVASHPFSAMTLPPLSGPTDSAEKVVRVSRERYGRKRELVEEKIARWSMSSTDAEDAGEEQDTSAPEAPKTELKKIPPPTSAPQLSRPPRKEERRRDEPRQDTRDQRRNDDRRSSAPEKRREEPKRVEERKIENQAPPPSKPVSTPTISLKDLMPKADVPAPAPQAPVQEQKNTLPQPASLPSQSQVVRPPGGESLHTNSQVPGVPGTGKKRRRRRRGRDRDGRDSQSQGFSSYPQVSNGAPQQHTSSVQSPPSRMNESHSALSQSSHRMNERPPQPQPSAPPVSQIIPPRPAPVAPMPQPIVPDQAPLAQSKPISTEPKKLQEDEEIIF